MSDHLELSPDNGWFLLLVPGVVLASGIAVGARARWVRRSPYFRTGDTSEPDVLGLAADPA